MKPANVRLVRKLVKKTLPDPEPDMTGWTSMERFNWQAQRRSLAEMVRESNQSGERVLEEVWDAEEAKDAAILAERAAKAAAERLAQHPGSAVMQINARATREAADKAWRAAEEAMRVAEEAKRRPPPPEPEPAAEAEAPTETPVPAPMSDPKPEPKPKRQRKRREPGMPKPQKQWWEERAQWRTRGPNDDQTTRHQVGRCLTEYDPLSGEIIGDGYRHPEDDDW
jgi:hypothetical protein